MSIAKTLSPAALIPESPNLSPICQRRNWWFAPILPLGHNPCPLCRRELLVESRIEYPPWRAAVSIASNIAEGAERNSKPDFIRFIHIAKGSAAELRTQIYIAQMIGLIDDTIQNDIVTELKELMPSF